MNIANKPCPCHSNQKYKRCCRPFHQGEAAPTPELLMRSRYSAYAMGLADYIIATTHPSNPEYRPNLATWREELGLFARGTTFEALRIEESSTDPTGAAGSVTFHATLKQRGQDASFRERSRFVRAERRWFYADAELHEEDSPDPTPQQPSSSR